jgi:hypothetical protein
VEAFLDKNPTFLEQLAGAPALNPEKGPISDILDLDTIMEDPPLEIIGPKQTDKPWLSRKGREDRLRASGRLEP